MPPYDVFISYRRGTWPFTHRLAEHLERLAGWRVFVDYTGIDESRFEDAILTHLQTSRCFLLVISPETFIPDRIHRPEDWVRREIREAIAADRPIALVLVEGLAPPHAETLPEDIRDITTRQGIEFFPAYFDTAVERLVDFVSKIAGLPLDSPADTHPQGNVSVQIGGDVSGQVIAAGGDVILSQQPPRLGSLAPKRPRLSNTPEDTGDQEVDEEEA